MTISTSSTPADVKLCEDCHNMPAIFHLEPYVTDARRRAKDVCEGCLNALLCTSDAGRWKWDTIEHGDDEKTILVDMVASGYDWECPNCTRGNEVSAWTEKVTCTGCDQTFETMPPSHPTG